MEIVGNDPAKKDHMVVSLKQMCESLGSILQEVQLRDKNEMMAELVVSSHPAIVTIFPPKHVHTKCSGKRIIGDGEKAHKKRETTNVMFNKQETGSQ